MNRVFCPHCGRFAEYDPYYGRVYCTFCSYRSDLMNKAEFARQLEIGKFKGGTEVVNGTRGSNKEV